MNSGGAASGSPAFTLSICGPTKIQRRRVDKKRLATHYF
jgi:hypothetical protein